MVDTFVEIVSVATKADPGRLFGYRKPAVRVHVTARDLDRGIGAAHLEGQSAPISITSVDAEICESGTQLVIFGDDGEILALGKEQRLFSTKQRIALTARDGGCRFPGCDRPPSMTEAHHIDHWSKGGVTDISNGLLLCRHHHMLVHNNHWSIDKRRGPFGEIEYWATPPNGAPLLMPSKSAVWRSLQKQSA
jgi:hypothetical protein